MQTRSLAHLRLLRLTALLCACLVIAAPALAEWQRAPEFTQDRPAAWINAKPMRIADLRGRVVLIDVWTFECWNCYRSFPWLRSVEERYGPRGLTVIGIHSPEYDRERDPKAVAAKVREFGLDHPVMIDNDFRYWEALDNRFWPAFYLVDRQGRIRYRFFGETHEGDIRAGQIEAALEGLLAEPE